MIAASGESLTITAESKARIWKIVEENSPRRTLHGPLFHSVVLFHLMGWTFEELELNARSFCGTDSVEMGRRFAKRHGDGTLRRMCSAILTVQRLLCERVLSIVDGHTHTACRIYAEGKECQGDRIRHAPIAHALAHAIAGEGPDYWLAVLARAQGVCSEQHASLQDGETPPYNCAYLELGGMHEAFRAGGLYDLEETHAKDEMRCLTCDLGLLDVSTEEHAARSSCMFGDAGQDRRKLRHFNSPCGSEFGTIAELQRDIQQAITQIEEVSRSPAARTPLTSLVHSPLSALPKPASCVDRCSARE